VTNANEALEQLEEARAMEDFTRVASLERALAFNVSGHILHSIFWRNLAPKAGGRPQGELLAAFENDFGSFDLFQEQMNEVAASIMGSGWAALVYEPLSRRLLVTQIHDHQSELSPGNVPLLVMDAWEHAYYLQYENRKSDFFAALWNLWNWEDVAARFLAARKLDLRLSAGAR
jgi:Fe-Mn family superoxide dismutase